MTGKQGDKKKKQTEWLEVGFGIDKMANTRRTIVWAHDDTLGPSLVASEYNTELCISTKRAGILRT